MPTALHPQTLLTLTYDGQPLPPKYGFPMKLRMPTKLGYKNPKHIQAIFVTNTYPGGYWEDQGYNWFGGAEGPAAARLPKKARGRVHCEPGRSLTTKSNSTQEDST